MKKYEAPEVEVVVFENEIMTFFNLISVGTEDGGEV